MDKGAYWGKKLRKYADADWAGKPSLFVIEAEKFFPKHGRVLELGCGIGDDGLWLAEQGYAVMQTDIVDTFFPEVSEQAKKRGLQIEHQLLDSRDLSGFADESYDIVFANLSLHYFDMATTKTIFAEIRRILKPGGFFAGLFNSIDDPEATEGDRIEENFYRFDGIEKRFLDVSTARELSKDFTELAIDNKGITYKDQAKGIQNLIRIIVKK